MPARSHHTAAVWILPAQASLIGQAAARAGLRITHAGCADAAARADVARSLEAEPISDPRAALAAAEACVFLFGDAADLGARAPDDSRVIRGAVERGVLVATLEPMPASVMELSTSADGGDDESTAGSRTEWARFIPLSRWTRPIREAREILESFGAVRSVQIQCLGGPENGSLGAQLLNAMDLVLSLLGEPESVDAAFAGMPAGRTVHAAPGDTLRALHGDLSASLRFSGGRGASVLASDQAGRWERVITVLGTGGRLRIKNEGLEWCDARGSVIDAPGSPNATRSADVAGGAFVAALAEQLETLVSTGAGSPGLPDYLGALSLAQTALLSARTGEGESPATIRRMAGM